METHSSPSEYERLERKLDDVKQTLDANHRAQQDYMDAHRTETKQCLKKLQDQHQLLQGQLSEINRSVSMFRERYHIPEPRPYTRHDPGAHLGQDKSKESSSLRPADAKVRRKSWAAGTHPVMVGSSISSGSEDEKVRRIEVRTNCMADAIKRNFVSIVETLPFKESEVADSVIEKTCVNESECEYIRGLVDRRDQVRTLVTMVIKRELGVMESFLEIVSKHSKALHKDIFDTFDELQEENTSFRAPCTYCSLVRKVDIKDICDHFYERGLLSDDDLYREIISKKSSEELWRKMLHSLVSQSPDIVMSAIIRALEHHGKFQTNIIRMLERDIKRRRSLTCRCPRPSSGQPPSGDTASPASSADVSSFSQHGSGSIRDSCEAAPTGVWPVPQFDSSTHLRPDTAVSQESSEAPPNDRDLDIKQEHSDNVSALPFSPDTTPEWTEAPPNAEDDLPHDHSGSVSSLPFSPDTTPEWTEVMHTRHNSELIEDNLDTVFLSSRPQQEIGSSQNLSEVPASQSSKLQQFHSDNISSLPLSQDESGNTQELSVAKPSVNRPKLQHDQSVNLSDLQHDLGTKHESPACQGVGLQQEHPDGVSLVSSSQPGLGSTRESSESLHKLGQGPELHHDELHNASSLHCLQHESGTGHDSMEDVPASQYSELRTDPSDNVSSSLLQPDLDTS